MPKKTDPLRVESCARLGAEVHLVETVMDAMDELRASGIEDMGLITDPRRTETTQQRGGE